VTFDSDYPFSYEDCNHNKVFTDPEGIGVCKQCVAMNMALSDTPLDMTEIESTYTILAGLHGILEALDDDE